jgi:cobalamin biosynthesis Mg chelatase CobN
VIRRNATLVEQRLQQQGVDADTARKAGLARLFGPAPQSFGPGLARMMESSEDNNNQGVHHSSPTRKPANIRMLPSLLSKVRVVSREEFERTFRAVQWDKSWAYWLAAILLGAFYPLLVRRIRYWSFDPVAFHDSLRGAAARGVLPLDPSA